MIDVDRISKLDPFYTCFIDDLRDPSYVSYHTMYRPDISVVRDLDEFEILLNSFGMPSFIFFDHDLGEKNGKLQEVSEWLRDFLWNQNGTIIRPPEYYVHSSNPNGKKQIISLMNSWSKIYYGNLK